MDVNEHERLSNTNTNPSKGTTGISKKGYGCKWTWETIPTQTQTQVREPLVLVRKDMDVNEHERLFNTDTNPSKGTTGISKKGYGCKWTWETIQHKHKHK